VILTLTPNPAVDLTLHVERVHPGESHRVPPAIAQAGGKGVNVARVLHARGIRTLALAPVGGDTGRVFESDIADAGVPHRLIPVSASTRRSVAIVDESSGQTSIFNETGAALSGGDWDAVMRAVIESAADARCLVGSGSLPPDAPTDLYARLVAIARDLGVPSVIDATGAALLEAASAGASLLKPNQRELQESTAEDDPLRGAQALLDAGAGAVLVSLGEAGMLLVHAGGSAPLRARLAVPLAGNPTGAGDAAVAAVAHTLAEHPASGDFPAEALLRRATTWSAAAVLSPVAGRLGADPAELESQLVVEGPDETRRESTNGRE
jgi:1-phosphofructokinase family hexose kinase